MFDIGWDELLLIGVVALIVIGPKDLPLAMRALARLINRARGLNREFQNSLSEVMREAELDEMRRKFEAAAKFDAGRAVKEAVDPTGVLERAFDPATLAGPADAPRPPAASSPPDAANDPAPPAPSDSPGGATPTGEAPPACVPPSLVPGPSRADVPRPPASDPGVDPR